LCHDKTLSINVAYYASETPNVLVFWSITELKREHLDAIIANTWVRLSSYTEDDVSRSMPVWSPYNFW